VASTCIYFGGKLKDLSGLDLAFAPPYSTAVDCLADAANLLRGKQTGMVQSMTPGKLKEKMETGAAPVILDLRSQEELAEGHIPGSRLMPMAALPRESALLDKESEYVLVSRLGATAYEAFVLMKAEGFPRVSMLEGGMAGWPYATAEKER
jgi:rhodanese-related sulfurtransferase